MNNIYWLITFSYEVCSRDAEKILSNMGCSLENSFTLFLDEEDTFQIQVEGPSDLPKRLNGVNGLVKIQFVGKD